jgi:hypothetical protein
VAAIVEMIHLATLVHDDILDGALVRRRVACINQRWDNQVAVLLGDFLYARAFALSTELSSRLCSRVLAETTRRLCVGEIEQSTLRYDFELDQAAYEPSAAPRRRASTAPAASSARATPGGNEEVGTRPRGLRLEPRARLPDRRRLPRRRGRPRNGGQDPRPGRRGRQGDAPVLHTYAEAGEARGPRSATCSPGRAWSNRAERLREACDLGPGVEYAMARARAPDRWGQGPPRGPLRQPGEEGHGGHRRVRAGPQLVGPGVAQAFSAGTMRP